MNKSVTHFWILSILLLALFSPIQSAVANIEVLAHVDRSEITIGDKIIYQIEINFPKTGTLILPSVLGNLGQFEVKDYNTSDPKATQTGRQQTWTFTLSTFTVGEYMIPPQMIEYTPENDSNKQVIHSDPIKITVKRTTAETLKDIEDITDLVDLPKESKWWLWLIGLGILVGLIGLILWWTLFRKKTKGHVVPRKPPYEEAIFELSRLSRKQMLTQGLAKEYCFKLSEILRTYISRRFEIEALESTTEEFLVKIESIPLTETQREVLKDFSEKSDLIKFANVTMSTPEGEAMLNVAQKFVKQTRPQIESESKSKKGGKQ